MSDTATPDATPSRPQRKRPLWRRLLKWFLLGLLIVLLVLSGLTAWVVGTRSGLDFAWSLLAPRLPDTIEVADVDGRLTGPLTITGVGINNASMHVEVKRIHLQWRVADLLSATVHVEQLAVSGVRYKAKTTAQAPPEPKAAEPLTLPDAIQLPVQVRIDQVAVDDVRVITAPGAQPIVLTRARLHDARLTADTWRIGSLTAHGPMFDIAAEAQLAPHDRYALQVSLDAELRLPDLVPIKTQVRIHGDLDQLKLTQSVAAPYNVALDATISNIALNALADIGIDATLKLDNTRVAAIGADLPELAPITTELNISGTAQQLTLQQTVAAPYNVALNATLKQLLQTPVIAAQLSIDGMQLAAIKKDLPKVTLATQLGIAGTPKQLDITLDARADSEQYGPLTAAARVHYTPQAVTIEQLRVQRPDTPMRLTAHGSVALAKGHAMDLDVQWQQLRWPLGGAVAYRSRMGHVQLTGTLDDYQVQAKLDWQVADQAAGHLQLSGSGDLQSFKLAQLKITGGPGTITARADVTWAPQLAVQAHLEGEHINPGAVVADIPGDFSLVADIRAGQHDGVITAHVDTLRAHGRLRGQPLQLDAQLAYLGDHIKIGQFVLDYAEATARISGRAGWTPDAALDLQWRIDAKTLSTLWPTLAGSLQTHGSVQGSVSAPSIDAALSAHNLTYGDYSVASVELDANVDWSGATQSKVTLAVADARAAGQVVHALELQLQGTPAAHTLELNIDSSTAQLELALNGGLNKQNRVWDFTLTSLRAAYGELAPWTLTASASGSVSADAQRIADACLSSGDARLCLSGQHAADGSQASVQLNDLAIAYVQPFLPDNLNISGALSGQVDARLPATGQAVIKAHFTTTAGRIETRQADGDTVQVLAFEPAQVDFTLAEGALDAMFALPLADTGRIQASVSVAPGAGALTQRSLTGEVDINVDKLDFVSRIVSEVAAIQGHIDGHMQISGTLAAPRVLGELALQAKKIVLLSPGLQLTDVSLTAAGHGNAIDISMAAHSGGGQLTVAGRVDLGSGGPTVQLAIQGERFQAANTPMVRAWISPDLKLKITPQAVRVSGRLEVPKARITPRNLPAAGVTTVSSDTVIVTQKDSVATTVARAIYANILVVLGDVRIKGFGLKTGIEGELRVTQEPGEPVTAAGKLTLVDGSYRAYGQTLDIQHGVIYFSGGPISNPGLELRAARYPAEDVTVGVHVRGSVSSPKVTLFSDPAMSEAEILSWLLLGRPLEGATGGQSNLVAKAALALGSGRGNKMLDHVGDALGLDDIGIGSAAGQGASEAAFMVGKYLTPKLYISYGIGIFSSMATFSMRYTLNSHWKLETQTSGTATGGDIIYTFER